MILIICGEGLSSSSALHRSSEGWLCRHSLLAFFGCSLSRHIGIFLELLPIEPLGQFEHLPLFDLFGDLRAFSQQVHTSAGLAYKYEKGDLT